MHRLESTKLVCNAKEKYARKKKDRKAADVSGTSTEAVSKAQKALQPYEFLKWLDGFMQTRQGRSNLPIKRQSTEEEKLPFDYEEFSELSPAMVTTSEGDPFDAAPDITEQDEQPPTVVKKSANTAAGNTINNTGKKKRAGIKGSARESLMEDMEFSLIRTLQDKVSNKRKADEDTIKEESNEDLFCKSLAADLKELPPYEKCIAKNEIRNIFCKYQMSAMNKQQNQQVILQTPVQAERVQQNSQYGFMQYNQSQFKIDSLIQPRLQWHHFLLHLDHGEVV